MLTIYLTRHGETEWNIAQKLQGWLDSPLTEKGKRNARELGARLKDIEFQTVYSSPSERSLCTAQLMMQRRTCPFVIEEDLKEIHFGDWEGQNRQVVSENYPQAYFNFWNAPHLYTSETGENFFELEQRLLAFFEKLKSLHQTGEVLIVTHTVVIKMLLATLKKQPLKKLWSTPPFIQDTSLTIVECVEDQLEIVLEADVSHISQEQEQVTER
ncbi:histidine phosphatase family protein [Exiguobacterium oxidotolerans]|uniref:phosphoglycerate mutase (2,3-diphosphoglycerate-dependent) n=1 Tax=Exiguobacterium oxidotolerans TaxID=223958 RepID=A0A653IHL3_9BACL|nr:histidine phosphatase family protein [Exiguobacterium oxidotolerans]VWX38725.1 Histidine phosphatase family protein [Exiguobacterium oxidotolerans]